MKLLKVRKCRVTVLDTDKIKEKPGWEPTVCLEEGLSDLKKHVTRKNT